MLQIPAVRRAALEAETDAPVLHQIMRRFRRLMTPEPDGDHIARYVAQYAYAGIEAVGPAASRVGTVRRQRLAPSRGYRRGEHATTRIVWHKQPTRPGTVTTRTPTSEAGLDMLREGQ
jgi:hypothetical protein